MHQHVNGKQPISTTTVEARPSTWTVTLSIVKKDPCWVTWSWNVTVTEERSDTDTNAVDPSSHVPTVARPTDKHTTEGQTEIPYSLIAKPLIVTTKESATWNLTELVICGTTNTIAAKCRTTRAPSHATTLTRRSAMTEMVKISISIDTLSSARTNPNSSPTSKWSGTPVWTRFALTTNVAVSTSPLPPTNSVLFSHTVNCCSL